MASMKHVWDEAQSLLPSSKTGLALNRTLEELNRDSKKIAEKSSRDGPSVSKAQFLLSQQGYDPDKMSSTINRLDLANTFEPLEPLSETDIEGLIRHEHETMITAAIEEGQRETIREFEENYIKAMESDWEKLKRKIFEELGHQGSMTESMSALSAPQKGVQFSSDPLPLRLKAFSNSMSTNQDASLVMHTRMKIYADVVKDINDARLHKTPIKPTTFFTKAISKAEEKNSSILECWSILSNMTNDPASTTEHFWFDAIQNPFQQRILAPRNMCIKGAREYLEKQFRDHVQKIVQSNRHQAMLGGNPSAIELIKSFLRIKFPLHSKPHNFEYFEDIPIWGVLYYLFRCGFHDQALDFSRQFLSNRSQFPKYLETYIKNEQRLPNDMRDSITREFPTIADPFKHTLYKIIGRCELNKKTVPNVIIATEDYIWLQLLLIREEVSEEESLHERYPLRDLQKLIRDKGSRHFDPAQTSPIKYFQILLLSGQFELAINYLYTFERYQTDAVHFAISLAYSGLLRYPPKNLTIPDIDLLCASIENGEEIFSFNFDRLIHRYSRIFAQTDPEKALHYLYLLCLGLNHLNEQQLKLAETSIRDLIYDTQKFDLFEGLGKYSSLVTKKDATEFIFDLVTQCAERCEEEGRFEDAIQLFFKAQKHHRVLEVTAKILGNSVSKLSPTEKEKIQKILQYCQLDGRLFETCQVLLKLADFFSKSQDGQDEVALQTLDGSGVLPTNLSDVDGKLRNFEQFEDAVKKNIGHVISVTMDILFRLYQKYEKLQYTDRGRSVELEKIKARATSLLSFAGKMKYRLPQEVYASLTQLEIRMK